MSRGERREQMGDKAKNFTNVYIKNFGEDMSDEKLHEMFEKFGKIVSARVGVCTKCNFFSIVRMLSMHLMQITNS